VDVQLDEFVYAAVLLKLCVLLRQDLLYNAQCCIEISNRVHAALSNTTWKTPGPLLLLDQREQSSRDECPEDVGKQQQDAKLPYPKIVKYLHQGP
jgi:hypothetical protein